MGGARHATRRLAVQALYALDMNPDLLPSEAGAHAREEGEPGPLDPAFLDRLVEGAWKRRRELDTIIEGASRRWRVRRMDRVDVSVLCLAAFELIDCPETPLPVVIDEAVELAKDFGTPESPAFINGILDRIAREHRPGEAAPGGG